MSSVQSSSLNPKPGSSSKRQHQTLVVAGKRRGFVLAEIRKAVGGSIRRLSAAECSTWIKHFSGNGLANPPGEKASVYKGKKRTDATRMITPDQIQQIVRLMFEYFPGEFARSGLPWLRRNFKARAPSELATAERAGQVIRVLADSTRSCSPKSLLAW